jgi:hypothetical protein
MDSESEVGVRQIIRHLLNENGVPFVIRDRSTGYTAFDIWPDDVKKIKILTAMRHRPREIMVHSLNRPPFRLDLTEPKSLEKLEGIIK